LIISIIVAVDEKNGIGKSGGLPWRLPSDLKRFKKITMGHHLLMGRKTYETIGRPLPGRVMIIVTRKKDYHPEGCIIVNSIEEGIDHANRKNESELFIIGGGEIFTETIEFAGKIYLTTVHADTMADIFFPGYEMSNWTVLHKEAVPRDDNDDYSSEFVILERAN
jgi:dihydrofolate reductase